MTWSESLNACELSIVAEMLLKTKIEREIAQEGLQQAEEFYLFILRITDTQNLRCTHPAHCQSPSSPSRLVFPSVERQTSATLLCTSEIRRKDDLERLLPNLL